MYYDNYDLFSLSSRKTLGHISFIYENILQTIMYYEMSKSTTHFNEQVFPYLSGMRLDTGAQSSIRGTCMQMSESIETGAERAIWTC